MTMTDLLNTPILVLVEHQRGDDGAWRLTPASAQVISLAKELTGGGVHVVALPSTPDAPALGALGAGKILRPRLDDLAPRVSGVVADAVLACIADDRYGAFLVPSSYRGREVASRVAMRLDSGVVADATALEVEGEALIATTVALAGTWTNRIRVEGALPVATVKTGAHGVVPAATPTAPVIEDVDFEVSPEAGAVEVVSSTAEGGTGRVSLADADVVVVAGRGTNGDMSVVDALADELGAAVGATRVVADEGWAPRNLQIGQTGANISPKLYIGLGVSGAIHHTVGMQSSAHIVAVCDDPDAPIFEIADFGVVGDLFEVVPQALEAIRAARGEN